MVGGKYIRIRKHFFFFDGVGTKNTFIAQIIVVMYCFILLLIKVMTALLALSRAVRLAVHQTQMKLIIIIIITVIIGVIGIISNYFENT